MLAAITCLAMVMYHEARGEGVHGQALVGYVVLNRVDDTRWPDNVCDVIHQGGQFSWYWDGESDTPTEPLAWQVSQDLAEDMFNNADADRPTDAVNFLSGPDPYWAAHKEFIEQYGRHKFYK